MKREGSVYLRSYSGHYYVRKSVKHGHQVHFKSASYVTNSITKAKYYIEKQFCIRGTVSSEPRTPNPLDHNPRGLQLGSPWASSSVSCVSITWLSPSYFVSLRNHILGCRSKETRQEHNKNLVLQSLLQPGPTILKRATKHTAATTKLQHTQKAHPG